MVFGLSPLTVYTSGVLGSCSNCRGVFTPSPYYDATLLRLRT